MPLRIRLARLALLGGAVGGLVGLLWAFGVLGGAGGSDTISLPDVGATRQVEVLAAELLETPPASDPEGRPLEVAVTVGALAPNFEATTLAGRRVALAGFRGRPVLINFWATWCKPCEEELPDLERLRRAYADAGVEVLAVNVGEAPSRATGWLREQGFEGFAYQFLFDPSGTITERYGVLNFGLPGSVMVDAAGIITALRIGQIRYSEMEELVRGAGAPHVPAGADTVDPATVRPAELVETPPAPSRPGLPVGFGVGRLAPSFEATASISERFTLADLRGGPVLLALWAMDCPGCPELFPVLDQLQKDLRDEGLWIVILAVAEPPEDVLAWLAAQGLDEPRSYVMFDPTGAVAAGYGVSAGALPTLAVLDAEGVITAVFDDPAGHDELAAAVRETAGP